MNKFPFNAVGFKELQQELYRLNDTELTLEAQQIKHQFREWLPSRFELQNSQLNFFQKMDVRALNFTADETSFAVGNRLPITLQKAEAIEENDDQGKIIYTKSSLSSSYSSDLGFTASGELLIVINYHD